MQTDQERAALKHELKSWESTFFAHHGRRPIQADIAADPIAKSYRKYEMLKKKSSTMTATASKTSSMLQRSKSISKGSGSEQHLDRIRKGFSFLNHTIPIPCNNVPATTSSNQTHAISAAHSSADPKSSSTMDENTNPSLSRSSTDPAAKIRFRRTSALPRTESFISPLNGLSRTASNINLPLSDDDDHVHEMANSSVQQQQTAEPSLQLGELAEKFMSAADAELFVPETSGSDLVHSVLVPLPESQMKPKLRRLSDRPTTTTDRVSLTNNFVKYDLKHDWRSKNKPARKSSWKSAKMYAIELKKKRIDERNSALYTDLLDDGLRLIQIQNKESHAGSESDNHPDERDHDFKRRRVDVPKTKTSPTPQVNLEASSEFNRDLALMVLNNVFGFQSFRINQFEVIDRIMHHQSTFAVLPTGAGKSLLYQMPAYLLPGICLVITPLLSLMKDQLSHLPSSIPGAIWSSNETVSQVQDLIMRLRANQIKVLFLSPERLQTQGFQRTIQSLPPPGVSFACIDEVHCVSQWSHNFRPAFVRVGNILRNHLAVQCILALTATATKHTLNSVCSTLMMNPDDIIMADVRRDNLFLSVSREHDQFSALVTLLNSDRFRDLSSIIIYVHQQRTADKVMFRLRTQGIDAVSYHAGKDAKTRRAIQEQFMSNKARIICATIAFGMGLDKHDVRAIIHFNCPQSMEHYVQEIGRAGRDGMPAFCHVFYDEDDVDRFRSLAFSNGVDGDQVIKFLRSIFDGNDGYGERYLVALSCTKQVQAYDLREEVVETFLTFLEFETGIRYIHALPMLHKTCTIRFLRTSEQQLAKADPILSEILSQSRSYSGSLSVNIVNIANSLHVPLADVHRTILTLKSLGEISAVWKDLCFCIEVLKRPDDLDALCADLINFCRGYESCKHRKVNIISQILKSVATERCLDTHPDCQSRLQQMISTYFICDSDEQLITEAEALLPDYERLESLCDKRPRPDHLIGDIKVLLLQWKDKLSTARQVARILHGISSPKFPYKEWCKYPAWGKYVSYPFENVLADATMVLESLH